MGEIAEMMLDGTLCQQCGCPIEDSLGDFPQSCAGCAKDEAREKRKPARIDQPRSSTADLPKWKNEAADNISVRYHCNHCIKHFATEGGARDHAQNVHFPATGNAS